jgi:alanine racemase
MELMRRTGLALIPMVKANAYGVGVAGVVRSLESLEPFAYGVASVDEGESLREMGISRPIIVFTPMLVADYGRAHAADLTVGLGDAEAIRAWGPCGRPYHLAIDTGMSRAGVSWRSVAALRDALHEWPPAGAFTHFHSAEMEDGSADEQVGRFFGALEEIGLDIPFLHADNSAAAARGVEGRWAAIRPGVFLYGVGSRLGVRSEPVVSLRARVVDVRWIEAGDTVSYDATYRSSRRERIATAAVGYGDGYPRALSGRASGLLNGAMVPQRGLVTMDMTMFDVTESRCEVGDVVTLIGADVGPESRTGPDMTVEGVARTANMSPYELLTGLAPRLERRFHGG